MHEVTLTICILYFNLCVIFSELIKVYDGIASFRHHSYKLISVPRHTSIEQLVAAAMWAFHLTGDPG